MASRRAIRASLCADGSSVASETASRPRIVRWLKLGVLAFLLWTALAVVFATQLYFAGLPWSQALEWSIPRWYAWGLLTPFVFWIDRRLHGMPSPVARFALHVPLGIAFTLLSIVLRLVARPLRGAPWPPDIGEFFLERFYSDLLIYAVIAGVSMSRDYAAQVRQRERQAAELALQTADLERRLVESRLQSLRAQLQPHFLFNALNTISAFTETDPADRAPADGAARRPAACVADARQSSARHPRRGADVSRRLSGHRVGAFRRTHHASPSRPTTTFSTSWCRVSSFSRSSRTRSVTASRRGCPGGRVEVTATRGGATVTLRVRDDGVGLPAGWQFDRDAGVGLRNVASRLEHLYGRADLLRVVPNGAGRRRRADRSAAASGAATPTPSRE